MRSVALFDHEEVGSDSAQGAGGPIMKDTITRVASALSQGQEGAVERARFSSFLVSVSCCDDTTSRLNIYIGPKPIYITSNGPNPIYITSNGDVHGLHLS